MTDKAGTMDDLRRLHGLVVESFNTRLRDDLNDEVPTDAATLGAAIKFLKDNNVTADPADMDDLKAMRETLAKQRELRRKSSLQIVNGAQEILDGD